MIRALLTTALFSSVAAITMTSSAETVKVNYERPTHEDVRNVELGKMANCISTDIPIFFFEGYVELHSAEYLGEAVNSVKQCEIIKVNITLIVEGNDPLESLAERKELEAYFDAYEIDATIEYSYSAEIDTLALNGRTAIVSLALEQLSS